MGAYINPKDMTKEQFLQKHGREVKNLDLHWPKRWFYVKKDLLEPYLGIYLLEKD